MNSTVNVLVNKALTSLLPQGTVAREANGGLAKLFDDSMTTIDVGGMIGMASHLTSLHQEGVFEQSSALDDWHHFFNEEEKEQSGFEKIATQVRGEVSKNIGVNMIISIAISLLPASVVKKMLQAIFSSLQEKKGSVDAVMGITMDYLKPTLLKQVTPEVATQLMGFASKLKV